MRYASLRSMLDPLLPTVEKPGRYVGIERNVTRKDLSKASVTLALAFSVQQLFPGYGRLLRALRRQSGDPPGHAPGHDRG